MIFFCNERTCDSNQKQLTFTPNSDTIGERYIIFQLNPKIKDVYEKKLYSQTVLFLGWAKTNIDTTLQHYNIYVVFMLYWKKYVVQQFFFSFPTQHLNFLKGFL